jgi:phage gpG-like protein
MLDFKFGLSWQYKEKKGSFTLLHRPFMEGIRNWSPAFELVADDVLEPYVKQAFTSEGASEGAPWQELAPSTVARRGSAHPILRVSGLLMESFEKRAPEHHEEIGPRKLVWGSDVPYALFHEFGTGGRVKFRAAGATKVIAASTKAARQLAESLGMAWGMVARPMLVYSRMLANEITSKMRSYATLIARQVGYRIISRPGEARPSPIEALRVGATMLRSNWGGM